MKKHVAMLVIASMLTMLLAGCGGNTEKVESGAVINTDFSNKTMVTVSGEKINMQEESFPLGATVYGFAMVMPSTWKEIPQENLYLARDGQVCVASYIPEKMVKKLLDMARSDMSEEELAQANVMLEESLIPFAALYVETDSRPFKSNGYRYTQTIAEANGYVYGIAYNTKIDTEGLGDQDKKYIDILVKSIDTMKKNVLIYPPDESKSAAVKGSLQSFEAEDMNGQAINESVFADYDLTMVNIWTTWCGPCVDEMDELEKLYKTLPDNVNLISICVDAADENELAHDIIDRKGVTFRTLVGNENLDKTLLQYLNGFPTTVFVDRSGKIVGDIQLGKPGGEDVVQAYSALINARLEEAEIAVGE